MKILITNDDGIFSEGLAILTKWATKLGEVYVVAPSQQQSGKSHAITIHSPFEISKVTLGLGEKEAYAVGSTPVDCVRFATLGLGIQFDLIFSGINKGYNLGEDILYSGTVGALFEASLRRTNAIAFPSNTLLSNLQRTTWTKSTTFLCATTCLVTTEFTMSTCLPAPTAKCC